MRPERRHRLPVVAQPPYQAPPSGLDTEKVLSWEDQGLTLSHRSCDSVRSAHGQLSLWLWPAPLLTAACCPSPPPSCGWRCGTKAQLRDSGSSGWPRTRPPSCME